MKKRQRCACIRTLMDKHQYVVTLGGERVGLAFKKHGHFDFEPDLPSIYKLNSSSFRYLKEIKFDVEMKATNI